MISLVRLAAGGLSAALLVVSWRPEVAAKDSGDGVAGPGTVAMSNRRAARGPSDLWADTAYSDRVVREVRALYQVVAKFPCVTRGLQVPGARRFMVCARGTWIGRIVNEGHQEAARVRYEFAFDSAGELRFFFETDGPSEDADNTRLYFSHDSLIAWLSSEGDATPRQVNASAAERGYRESFSRELAAACLAVARRQVADDEHISMFCNKDP